MTEPTPYPQPVSPQPTQHTNTMAILALVFAFVFTPLGIIFGFVSLSQMKKTGEQGRGLALAGIWIGFVTIALAFLMMIMMFFFIVVTGVAVSESVKSDSVADSKLTSAAIVLESYYGQFGYYPVSADEVAGAAVPLMSGDHVYVCYDLERMSYTLWGAFDGTVFEYSPFQSRTAERDWSLTPEDLQLGCPTAQYPLTGPVFDSESGVTSI